MKVLGFFILIWTVVFSKATDDCDCKKLYSRLCLAPPKQLLENNLTFQNLVDGQPFGGYRGELGDEMGRLNMAQILLGRKLRLTDNFSDMCFKVLFRKPYPQNKGGESTLLGFGILQSAQVKCIPSKRVKGMLSCQMKTREPSKYVELLDLYFNSVDTRRNLSVVVMCFADGNVGWHSLSSKGVLTGQDKQFIEKYVNKLGFPSKSTVQLYGSKCE